MRLTKNKTTTEPIEVPTGAAWDDYDHFWAFSRAHANEEEAMAQRALADGQRTRPEIVHYHRYSKPCDGRPHVVVRLDG